MTTTDIYPQPKFDHLLGLTDRRGTAEFGPPGQYGSEPGYRVDDAARVLVVATREPGPDPSLNGLAGVALRFLGEAQASTGGCRSRMDSSGEWVDEPSVADSWGLCLWALGTAAAHSNVAWARQSAMNQFGHAAQQRSSGSRAMAFAAVGAAELMGFDAGHGAARDLLTDYAAAVWQPQGDVQWPWPEPRLTFANAILAEAMIAAGVALDDSILRRRGLEMLAWLLAKETGDGHLSPTPVAGRGPGDDQPAFEQHPLEAATIADACARAAGIDPDPIWRNGIHMAAGWFLGANDVGEPMWDPSTGAGYDGLTADGVDVDQCAESTLAVISTLQQAQRLSTAL